jgi:hypothetical protein
MEYSVSVYLWSLHGVRITVEIVSGTDKNSHRSVQPGQSRVSPNARPMITLHPSLFIVVHGPEGFFCLVEAV